MRQFVVLIRDAFFEQIRRAIRQIKVSELDHGHLDRPWELTLSHSVHSSSRGLSLLIWVALSPVWVTPLLVSPLLVSPASAAETWPLVPDPPATTPKWSELEGKAIDNPGANQDVIRSATGAPVLVTGHAAGSTARTVWSLTDFSKLGTLAGRFDTSAGGFAVSPDGKLVTIVKKKNFSSLGAEVWSVEESKKLKAMDAGPTAEPIVWSGFVSSSLLLTFHADDQGKTKLRLIDVTADKPAQEIAGPQNADPRLVSLSPGGQLFAMGLKDGSVTVIDLREKQSHKPFRLPSPKDFGKCIGVKFSPDGTELGALFSSSDAATVNGEIAVAAWNLADGEFAVQLKEVRLDPPLETIPVAPPATGATLVNLDWLPDGTALLVGNKTLIDRESGHTVWRLKLPATGLVKFAPEFLGTDYMLLPGRPGQLGTLKLPWREIDSGLKALQSKSPAWLQPGDKVSLQFEFGGLRFQTPDQVKTAITTSLQTKLEDSGFEVADKQPVTLKVAYAESSGSTLQKRDDDFPFPRPPSFRPPGFPGRFPRQRGTADETTGTGTAFVIHPDGYLLTCAHVVGTAAAVQVKVGEKNYYGRVVAKNVPLDFALLKIEVKNLAALPLADSSKLELGEEVRAVGYPLSSALGESIKATRGTLAGLVKKDSHTMFQIDASINPGNSGGPLINDLGEVVGINSAKLVGAEVDNVGFSIPINDVKAMLQEQKVKFETKGAQAKLSGPDLIKRVTPAVAFVTTTGGIEAGPDGDSTVVVTRIACLISLMIKDHPEPVWSEQIVVEPRSLRVNGQLTEQRARDLAFETFTQRLATLSLPYYISKDPTPITLPVITDLSAPDAQPQPVSTPRKTRRGMSN